MRFSATTFFLLWMAWVGSVILLPAYPFGIVFAFFSGALLLLWKKSRKRVKAVLMMTLPLAFGFWLIHGGVFASWVNPGCETVLSGRGTWAFGLWLKIFSIVTASQLWMERVPPPALIRSLFAGSMPVSWTFLLAGPLLLAEQVRSRTVQIREAQLARGVAVAGCFRERVSALTSLIFPLILGLLNDLPARSAALDQKAFKLYSYRNSLLAVPTKQRVKEAADDFPIIAASAIQIRNAAFYPEQGEPALFSISECDCRAGEWVLVRSGNGSGKSTLGMILSGCVPEHRSGVLEGDILISGLPLESRSSLRWSPHTQLVQQNPFLSFSGCTFTVGEEVAFGPENLALEQGEIRERVGDALDIVDAAHLGERELLHLSGGEAQRVAIASALAMRPRLLLLDEAFSRIHENDIPAILSRLKAWSAKNGTTTILFEKKVEIVQPFCDVSAHIKDGELLFAPYPTKMRIERSLDSHAPADEIFPEPDTSLLELRDVSFTWKQGDTELLHSLNASLCKASRSALVGINGAGKSTLLRLCAGLLKPSGGEILLAGEDVGAMHPGAKASRVGFLFQDPERQIFHSTVAEEILFSLRNDNFTQEEKNARMLDALRLTGLQGKEKMHPLDLNSAERRMVAIASLSVRDLDLLLLDEPTRELDDYWLDIFIKWMDSRHEAVLAICHDLHLVSEIFDRTWSLHNGALDIHKRGPALDIKTAMSIQSNCERSHDDEEAKR